jgi:osmotically-inducible protein OsmY
MSGVVRSVWAKDEAVDEARKADDVKQVVSRLTIARAESDEMLGESIAERLRRYVFFSIFDDVNVEVASGVATLTGYVTMPYKSKEMARLASRTDGVQQVVDKIGASVSGFDDQIRCIRHQPDLQRSTLLELRHR